MGNKRNFSARYRFFLTLCRLFKLQRVMELPPEKAKKLCYAVMPFVKDAMPGYQRMLGYISGDI